ncbi:gamma-glutamyltransferase [Nitrosomonas mobilis]|uniref:Glutathione hydrolase proenzyme n=1 Tax=Nitrosomonas mobilis TaxID=51642 RepID=A0A1G5SDD1_9PROT|nr:gamma-glutamyltransferase [Nitrosomonas mobilis]SCZ85216.1 Gamma-glutamyltransferase [Nitrosomonas mobilis]
MKAAIRKQIYRNLMRTIICLILSMYLTANHAGYAVVTAHPLATRIGEQILEQGGNAFDAAVAVAAALAVVEPYASGLGGGGFWLLHRARDGFEIIIDGRETAPENAHEALYLDDNGNLIPHASLTGGLAAAIPGTPAALAHVTRKYGNNSLMRNLIPAIRLARKGFIADSRLVNAIANHQQKLSHFSASARIFTPDGRIPAKGERFYQRELAKTLAKLGKHGESGFYRGMIATDLIRSINANNGIWTQADLEKYRVIERPPTYIQYRDAKITTAGLPSAGGLTLAQALNILEQFDLKEKNDIEQAHLIIESMRRAYEDRTNCFGDTDFVIVDIEKFSSKAYAARRATTINLDEASQSQLQPNELACRDDTQSQFRLRSLTPKTQQNLDMVQEGENTSHFSIMDSEGNRVATTLSINTFFGSGLVAGNTGILVNSEMDDFTTALNASNIYGLRGSLANTIKPGKRPLSSMSPIFVENNHSILIGGTPGGARIISSMLLIIISFIDKQQTEITSLISNPRYHHQYLPDEVLIEADGFNKNWVNALKEKGHEVTEANRKWGNMQLIIFDKATDKLKKASDPRAAEYVLY